MRPFACALALTLATPALAEELVIADDGGHATAGAKLAVGCAPPSPACRERVGSHKVIGLFGLRGSETLVDGADPRVGVSLSSLAHTYVTDPRAGVSARASHVAFLGGGRGGMEGGLGLDLGFGLYHALGRHHGPFSRLGGRGYLLGNPSFYQSLLELPTLQLGYQLLGPSRHLELAARGGPVLTGRWNPDGEERRLGGSFEWGGHAALHAGAVNLELEFSHLMPNEDDAHGGMDSLTAFLCGGARYLGACFDVRFVRGASGPSSAPIDGVLFGLSLGSFTDEQHAPR